MLVSIVGRLDYKVHIHISFQLTQMLSDLGGNMGMYIGASLFTFFEFFQFFYDISILYLATKKDKKICNNVEATANYFASGDGVTEIKIHS